MTLLRRSKDLAQRRGAPIRRDIPASEVRTHNKPYDGWMILRGKVYNITPYLAYHPGGSEIMEKCLGGDGTVLFDKYHSWVNIEPLVGPLLLGYLKIEKRRYDSDDEEEGYLKSAVGLGGKVDVVLPLTTRRTESTTSGGMGDTTTTPNNTSNANNAASVEFAMPKPRPPKGNPIPSLRSNDDSHDDEVEEELL